MQEPIYDYYQLRLNQSLASVFVEKIIKQEQKLDKPCYLNPKEKPNVIYVPIELYDQLKKTTDAIYFQSTRPELVCSKNLIRYLHTLGEKMPQVGSICTTQIEAGEFIIVSIDEKKKTALLRNSKTSETMSVPFKYLDLGK